MKVLRLNNNKNIDIKSNKNNNKNNLSTYTQK